MPNVFEGPTDGRQSAEVAHPVSRFRPTYRALTTDEKGLHDAIKSAAAELERVMEEVPYGRYKALALTSLEESVMWAVKAVTA